MTSRPTYLSTQLPMRPYGALEYVAIYVWDIYWNCAFEYIIVFQWKACIFCTYSVFFALLSVFSDSHVYFVIVWEREQRNNSSFPKINLFLQYTKLLSYTTFWAFYGIIALVLLSTIFASVIDFSRLVRRGMNGAAGKYFLTVMFFHYLMWKLFS